MGDKQSVGVYLDASTVEEADTIKQQRDRLQRDSASRSAVLADSIELGLESLEWFEDEYPHTPIVPRKSMLRQALDYYDQVDSGEYELVESSELERLRREAGE